MHPNLRRSVLGVIAAIVITTAMDASGLSAFSALPLLPLMLLYWYLDRPSPREIGFVWGPLPAYLLAVMHAVIVLGLLALTAWIAGAINFEKTNWSHAAINFAAVTLSTIVGAMVTEEGFFRGWLWTSLRRTGRNERQVLGWTSVAFALWHLSAVLLDTGFNPPLAQVPLFIVNAAVMGAIWGMLRMFSGSIVVSSVAHGVWNGGAYVLFGFGTKVGALGIQETALYGPEVGVLGLLLNLAFAAALWQWCRHARRLATAHAAGTPDSSAASHADEAAGTGIAVEQER